MLSSVALDASSGSVTTSLTSKARALMIMKQTFSVAIDRLGGFFDIRLPHTAKSGGSSGVPISIGTTISMRVASCTHGTRVALTLEDRKEVGGRVRIGR